MALFGLAVSSGDHGSNVDYVPTAICLLHHVLLVQLIFRFKNERIWNTPRQALKGRKSVPESRSTIITALEPFLEQCLQEMSGGGSLVDLDRRRLIARACEVVEDADCLPMYRPPGPAKESSEFTRTASAVREQQVGIETVQLKDRIGDGEGLFIVRHIVCAQPIAKLLRRELDSRACGDRVEQCADPIAIERRSAVPGCGVELVIRAQFGLPVV